MIEVSPGTCHERINFGGKNITVRSTYLTNPDAVATTIIDGGAGGTVVTFAGTETAASLRGLSITNGLGDEGGGIYGAPAGCTIDHCVIYGNQADYGGGIGLLRCHDSRLHDS